MKKGIEISGAIFANEGNIDHDEFLDKFIEFIEANGWGFGGVVSK
ncbi:YggL family protein [Paenibacillus pini]|nr:YggL family protein [Paenibacillus pini]